MQHEQETPTPRRRFLGSFAAVAATLGLAAVTSPLKAMPPYTNHEAPSDPNNPDAWFDNIKGKHRMVFDFVHPKEGHESILPFAWPKVFLLSNAATGTPEKDNSVVVVMRHNAICFAMEDSMWKKYKLGAFFNVKDGDEAAVRNMFWKPNPPFEVPGIGPVPIGINDLQASGVMFCVCDMAMNVNSFLVAQGMKLSPQEVKKDWLTGILPGIQVVPSGLWALGRAQEHKCNYIAV